jgi:hypothetical protein
LCSASEIVGKFPRVNYETTGQVVRSGKNYGYGTGALSWFVASAAVVLAVTGIAKVWSALGNVKLLTVVDPIVGIPFKHLMLGVGVVELVIAGICLFSNRHALSVMLVAWLSTNFLVYRVGLWWMGWKKPCGCLGNLTDALGITPQTADRISMVLLAYLLIGSGLVLLWQWRQRRAGCSAARPRA